MDNIRVNNILTFYSLCYFLYPTTLYPYNSLGVASMFLLSLSAICSLYHRYLSGHIPNIYRTNTGHLPDIYWTRIEGTPLLYAYYIEAACKIDISSSIVLHKTEHTSRKSDTSEAPNGSLSNYLFRVYIERIRTLCDIICGLLSLLNNLSLLSQHKNINSAINRVCCRIYINDFIPVSLITDWSLPSRSIDSCDKD